jgi:hypothetical protein
MSFGAQQQDIALLFNKKIYVIPRNQRRYVWQKENWKDLLEDLLFIIQSKSDKSHFIGSIVLIKSGSEGGISKYTIIDGQQRTFTILFLLTSIVYIFKEKEEENLFYGLSEYIMPKDISNNPKSAIVSDYYDNWKTVISKVCEWDNKENLSDLFRLNVLDRDKYKYIEECVMFFYETLRDKGINELTEIRDVVLKTNYVEIVASSEEDSYTIFEILNARGQQLEAHELLKNYVMRYIEPRNMTDKVKEEWHEYIEKPLGSSVSRFFQHYMKHRYKDHKVDQKDVYYVIKKEVGMNNVDSFFNDVLKKAIYYERLLHPTNEPIRQKLSETEVFVFSFFNRRKAVQFRPVLLSLMHQKELGNIPQDKYENVLTQIYNFWVCYNIVGEEKSNKLEDVIRKYSPLIENEYSEKNIDEFINGLHKRLPSKDAFVKLFSSLGCSHTTPFYNEKKNKERATVVLELIERFLGGNSELSFTIEHAIPDSNGSESAFIGNLLPLEKSLNESLKNKPLAEKIEAYEDSNFITTRNFAKRYGNDLGAFNPNKRSEYLAKEIYEKILKLAGPTPS